jgi:hypothetical protein
VFEAAGLSTVAISSMRGQTERLHPRRALHCELPIGRSLGKPNDVPFQRRVLDAAFALLERPAGPVLEDFADVVEAEVEETLACAVPPRLKPDLPREVDEALGYRTAYERQLARTGRTLLGRVMDADKVPEAIAAFLRVAAGVPWREAGLPGTPAASALDVRAYYEEAAQELAGHVPAAGQTVHWFYSSTLTGQLLRYVRQTMLDAGEAHELYHSVVPRTHHALPDTRNPYAVDGSWSNQKG